MRKTHAFPRNPTYLLGFMGEGRGGTGGGRRDLDYPGNVMYLASIIFYFLFFIIYLGMETYSIV